MASPSPTRLRQIALVAKDIDLAQMLLCTVLDTEVIFVDPAVTRWVAIGGDVVEVVSPTQPNTTAGRILEKRGDGGYMIIMQTLDAVRQRGYIESNNLRKVIYSHSKPESVCIQYHPKGVKGGVIPELDSHNTDVNNPDPLGNPYSPWHASGPSYSAYSAGMKRCSHLKLVNVTCRLAPGDSDIQAAVQQWTDTFSVPKGNGPSLAFTNADMSFVPGLEGYSEGISSITLSTEGDDRLKRAFWEAQKLGLPCDQAQGWVDMLGVRWYIVKADNQRPGSSRL
ncbi:hypothetical protein FQN57_005662 [Myotisia sp. PD_48]|nr:hypothetical protein FQN57_005662 [Myotisia sp. PD_48]